MVKYSPVHPEYLRDFVTPNVQPAAHPGLIFDRYADTYLHAKDKGKVVKLASMLNNLVQSAKDTRIAMVERHRELIKARGMDKIEPIELVALEPFVTGMGLAHPLENGLTWHPIAAAPYGAGSGVKGMTRAWATHWADLPPNETEDTFKAVLSRIFGPERRLLQEDASHANTGSVIFFDLLPYDRCDPCDPCDPCEIIAEVMTPHQSDWYAQLNPTNAPGDWNDPVPIPFLCVKRGCRFVTGVAPRTPAALADAELAQSWLIEALAELGFGAKTATGFGRMSPLPS